jgi:hypothetical protein
LIRARLIFIFARIFHAPTGQIFSVHLASDEMQKQEALSAPFANKNSPPQPFVTI